MNQFYPDGMRDMALNRAQENGGLVTPPEEDFNTDAMRGSMQQILADNLGNFVVCEFLVGTQAMTRKEGILYNVGRSYLTLYEENSQTFVVCDIFSVKFVTFYLPGQRPGQSGGGISVPTVNIPGVGTVPAGPYGIGTGSGEVGSSTQPRSTGNRSLGGRGAERAARREIPPGRFSFSKRRCRAGSAPGEKCERGAVSPHFHVQSGTVSTPSKQSFDCRAAGSRSGPAGNPAGPLFKCVYGFWEWIRRRAPGA